MGCLVTRKGFDYVVTRRSLLDFGLELTVILAVIKSRLSLYISSENLLYIYTMIFLKLSSLILHQNVSISFETFDVNILSFVSAAKTIFTVKLAFSSMSSAQ